MTLLRDGDVLDGDRGRRDDRDD